MIKKILTLSAGIVLGSMISTASLANDYQATDNCLHARSVHALCFDALRYCRTVLMPMGLCEYPREKKVLQFCKRTALRVSKAVCTDGTYDEPAHTYEELAPDYPFAFPNYPNHFYEDDLTDHRLECIPFCERILNRDDGSDD